MTPEENTQRAKRIIDDVMDGKISQVETIDQILGDWNPEEFEKIYEDDDEFEYGDYPTNPIGGAGRPFHEIRGWGDAD